MAVNASDSEKWAAVVRDRLATDPDFERAFARTPAVRPTRSVCRTSCSPPCSPSSRPSATGGCSLRGRDPGIRARTGAQPQVRRHGDVMALPHRTPPPGPTGRARIVRRLLAAVWAATTLSAVPLGGAHAAGGVTTRVAELDGAQVGRSGDADGSGAFIAHIGPNGTKLCWALTVRSIDRPTAIRVHKAARGATGPVALGFKVLPAAGDLGAASGCVPAADAVLDAMRADASQFYVSVSTKALPDGAIRGQLRAVGS